MIDERTPRKKKKKKKKSNHTVLIVSLAGGGLLVMLIVVMIIMLNRPRAREAQAKGNEAPVKQTPPAPQPKFEPKPKKGKDLISTVARRMDMIEVKNNFRQLGLAFQASVTGRGPTSYKELGLSFANSPLKEWTSKGWVKVAWGADLNRLPNGASNTALAWETDPDSLGRRVVLMGDGSVQDLDEAAFAKTPKAMGR